jgi:hypothetical protein
MDDLKLGPDEQVLWHGRPKRGLAFTVLDIVYVPFALIWCAMAFRILFASSSRSLSDDWIFLLPRLAFPIFGVYIAFGRFITDALYRSKLTYAVTNRRVIMRNGLFGGSMTSFDRRNLPLRITEQKDGRGTISFTASVAGSLNWAWFPLHACAFQDPMLFRIKDARRVYDILAKPEKS